MAVPSRLNEYPVGTVMPTTGLDTPRCSILAIRRGRAASDEEVLTISRYSRARYFMSEKMFTPDTSLSTVPSTSTMNRMHVT